MGLGVFSLSKSIDGIVQASELPGFNTDSIFDVMSGDFVKGYDSKWYCRGGVGAAFEGMLGRPGQFKSTLNGSLAMRICSIYQTEFIIFDSELTYIKNRQRILDSAGNHKGVLGEDNLICLDAKTKYDLESMRELIEEMGEKKLAMKPSDLYFTTPFLDKDGNRVKLMRPTVIFIDSWSDCQCREVREKITDKGLDDSAAKTLYMADANKKTLLSMVLNKYASKYGLSIFTTAHYGAKINMDPYAPNPKVLQWGSTSESAKNVGGKYQFYTNPQLLINSCTKMQDDAKQCKYKLGDMTSPVELNEILVLVQRGKGNASGLMHPLVVSQEVGLVSECTDYNYLRSVGKGFSMTGNNITHQPFLMPDVNLTRNTFRSICQEDPRVTRALQIGAQWLYIQNNWSSRGLDFPIKVEPKKLTDFLMSDKNKYSKDRILNSRGYWLPDELITDETPEYMSIFDILNEYGKSCV